MLEKLQSNLAAFQSNLNEDEQGRMPFFFVRILGIGQLRYIHSGLQRDQRIRRTGYEPPNIHKNIWESQQISYGNHISNEKEQKKTRF